jgi:hypothetical protein
VLQAAFGGMRPALLPLRQEENAPGRPAQGSGQQEERVLGPAELRPTFLEPQPAHSPPPPTESTCPKIEATERGQQ